MAEGDFPVAAPGAGEAGRDAAWPLPRFLRACVAAVPDAVALEIPPGKDRPQRDCLTYAELDVLSDRLARHLAPRIAGEAIVALLLPRASRLNLLAQLAVLKAGGAYTCLDPGFPLERIAEIFDDAEPVAVLTDAAGLARLQPLDLPPGLALDVATLLAEEAAATELPEIAPDRLAYVIYTSGTTGKPKGVMVEHRAIANLVAGDLAEFALGPGDRVVQGSSSAYDSSIEETWLALASGATLVVMDDAAARLGPDLIGWLQAERATVFCPPPTLLRSSGCHDPATALPELRLLYVGGEALPHDIADQWSAGRRMVNGYGPTECAVTCVRGEVLAERAITIGKPVPGMEALVLDEALEPVATGAQGELCMRGAGLARGYRNLPGFTAEKFVEHPVLGRIYRTGDLVHCDTEGDYHYHGRIDAQVKLRGYRIELGEIEARLAGIAGVRDAACRLQGDAAGQELVAWVVADGDAPDGEALRSELAKTLPGYMVPRGIGFLAALPTTVGGKLDRKALPELALSAVVDEIAPPEGPVETLLAAAAADILKRPDGVSVTADFFEGLGGDSLSAAMLVTLLREHDHTEWITVSDIYEARTIRALALLATRAVPSEDLARAAIGLREGVKRPLLTGLVQTGWLALVVLLGSWASWAAAFVVLPWLFARLGLVGFVVLSPLLAAAGALAWLPVSVAIAVLAKRLLIGRYRAIRSPVGSGWYARHWLVVQVARLIPWGMLQGSRLQASVLRALGATIGQRVHIAPGVELRRGGWDLLTLEDDVAVGVDGVLGLVELDRGDVVVGPVTLGRGATLQTRAGLCGGASMGAGSQLQALSILNPGQHVPDGEFWTGVPAVSAGMAPAARAVDPAVKALSPWAHDGLMAAADAALALVAVLPAALLAIGLCLAAGVDVNAVGRWLWQPVISGRIIGLLLGLTFVATPVTLVWQALLMRSIGRVRPGTFPRWSLAYIRAALKADMVRQAGEWLSGTVFYAKWLRLAGMDIGPKCEISTIIDVVPELVTIGAETFFADGIYLGGGHAQAGTVTLAHTQLGRNTFLGNHAVVPPGERLPDDILIGIATLAEAEKIHAGGARFGQPSFDLPRREVVSVDRSLTHDPSAIRIASRVFWELLRFALPVLPLLLGAAWYAALAHWRGASPGVWFGAVLPGATLAVLAVLCLAVTGLKWALIGRARPGQHALWSCWCSRWDFVFVAWAQWAYAVLVRLEGTWLLPWYLRAMGLKIGKGVVLGPEFAQVVDPDMIIIEDGATASPMFQAHTFEDRVLKLGHVRIGRNATVSHGTVPLYGAVVGEGARVGPHSVIMKEEHLLPGVDYQGVPTRVYGREG